MARTYPYTITRGQHKGTTVNSAQEYSKLLSGGDTVRVKRTSANGVTKQMVEGLLQFVNLGLAVIPMTREDKLEPIEIEALAVSAVEMARNNKTFARLIVNVCTYNANGQMGVCCGAILARRVLPRLAQRDIVLEDGSTVTRGLIPVEVAFVANEMAGGLIAAIASGATYAQPSEPTSSDEAVSPNGRADDLPDSLVIDLTPAG